MTSLIYDAEKGVSVTWRGGQLKSAASDDATTRQPRYLLGMAPAKQRTSGGKGQSSAPPKPPKSTATASEWPLLPVCSAVLAVVGFALARMHNNNELPPEKATQKSEKATHKSEMTTPGSVQKSKPKTQKPNAR